MMREPKSNDVPDIKPNQAGMITQVREYQLITPLFGGGVIPAEADPVTVVRGTEVRGHLRFWWRATQGGRFEGDLAKMKKAEDDLWGAAVSEKVRGPSRVQVAVEVTKQGKAVSQSKQPKYVAFPLVETNGSVREDVHFKLELTLVADPEDKEGKKNPARWDEVQAALWAWETFGGIGARTRRGFGALQCLKIDTQDVSPPQSKKQVDQLITEGLTKYVSAGQWPADMPHLERNALYRTIYNPGGPTSVWGKLVEKLKEFRQNRDGNQGYGHSRWPEPDAIRALKGRPPRRPRQVITKFPRAHFGLPIIFHMPHDNGLEDFTLQGDGHDRLASPLLLRPIACANGAVGVALILKTPPLPRDLPISEKGGGSYTVQTNLTATQAGNILPLNGKTDVLKAFLDTLN